jgi:hypothetical protein
LRENFLSASLLLLHRSSSNREQQKLSKVNSDRRENRLDLEAMAKPKGAK